MDAGPATGEHFGGYSLFEEIGRGGMGVVYRAEHRHLGRAVALKMLTPKLAADPDFRERFLRESRIAASLDHPSVVTVYDAGEVGGTLYIAMRLVRGTDLAALLRAQGPLAAERALAIVGQVAGALDEAHSLGLVHRDVKPANVLIEGARCYLTDFGLTKQVTPGESAITSTGQFLGTADYVAPEQIEGLPLDGRTDVYALGAVLFECVTQARPYPGRHGVALLYAHLHEPPPRPSEVHGGLPEAVDDVVAKAMAKAPDDRYGTCAELVEAARAAFDPRAARARARGEDGADATEAAPATVAAPAGRPTSVRNPTTEPPTAGLPASTAGAAATGATSAATGATPAAPVRAPRRGLAVLAAAVVGAAVAAAIAISVAGDDSSKRGGDPPGAPAGGPRVDGKPIPVGSRPYGLAFTGGALWVANSGDDTVTRVAPDGSASREVEVGDRPIGVAGGAGDVWVANSGDGTLERIDPRTAKPVGAPLDLGERPHSVTLSPNRVFVTNDDGTVSEFYALSGRVRRAPFPAGKNPRGIVAGFNAAWVANSGEGTVSRLSHGVLVDTIRVGRNPAGVAESPQAIWVANEDDDTVSRIDPTRPSDDASTHPVGDAPLGLVYGAGYVWVTNSGEDTVIRLDPDTGEQVGEPIRVRGEPTALAVGAGSIWVTANDRDEVVRIDPD